MSALFSLKLWLIFVQRIVNTLYPANILSLFFLYPVRGKIKVNSGMKFILILLAVDLFIRMIAFFSGIPFSHRYLYPMMIIVTIFSGLGMLSFINILWKHLIKRFPALTERGIGVVVLLIVFFSYSGKALHSSNDKKWLKDISLLIKSRIVPGREAAILSNYDESRFVYYSGCGELLLFSPEKDFLIRRHVRYENDSKWRVESEGFDGFNHYLKSSSGQVFIIYRIKKSEIKPNTESFFPEVKFIGKFSDNRRKYEYFVFQKNERK